MKNVFIFLIISILASCSNQDNQKLAKKEKIVMFNSLLMSYFGHQEIYCDSKMKIPFAAIDDHLDKVRFSVNSMPDFVKMKTFQNGSGYFEVLAPSKKKHVKIQLGAANGHQKSFINCSIKVEKPIYPIKRIESTGYGSQIFDCKNIPNKQMVYLKSGFYKEILIEGKSDLIFLTDIHSNVQIGRIKIVNSNNIKLQGLWVCSAPNFLSNSDFLIDVDSLSENISIVNCTVQSIIDSKTWTQDDWDAKASGGVYVKGQHCKVANNFVQNVFHAIQTDGDFNEVSCNIVDRFGGDAIRNTGNDNKFIRNTLKNAVVADYADKDGNHDDLFQSWTFGAPIERIEIVQNNCVSILEPDLPLKSKVVQGIACFDGFEEDWLIQQNLVVIDHPHGIALFGAKNCKIAANKVIRNPYHFNDFEADPWIMINRHKDGRKSASNEVEHNLVDTIIIKDEFSAIEIGNDFIDKDPKNYFLDYDGWDFRKK